MKVKTRKIILGILSIVILVATFFGGYALRYFTLDDDVRAVYDLVTKYKKYYYFDDGDLVKDISHGILDDYSTYYTKDEYLEIMNSAKGNFSGIGISIYSDSLKIMSVYGNSPAEKAGIKEGGVITAIDIGSGYIGVDNFSGFTAVIDAVDNDKDFKLKLSYNGEIKEFTLAKKQFKRTYVHYYDQSGCYGFNDLSGSIKLEKLSDDSLISNSSVGYIVYDSFNGTENNMSGSKKQFEEVLKKFKEDGRESVIIDLRNNPGGYMSVLSDVSRHFIGVESGKKVAISVAKDKYGNEETFYSSSVDYDSYNFKNIIILANENSASASEAFIGAVLDYDSKNIVKVLVSSSYKNGEKVYKTYGKGIMQNTYLNLDGSAVKLTIAEIFWPVSQASIHGVGVLGTDSGKILAVESDNALQRAIELVN